MCVRHLCNYVIFKKDSRICGLKHGDISKNINISTAHSLQTWHFRDGQHGLSVAIEEDGLVQLID